MRAAAPARARTWRTRNARTRLRAAVHMLPCSPAPAETSASRRFAPQVCRRSEIQRIASISHCCLPPSCAAGSSAPLRVNRSAVLLCTWRAHTAFSPRSHPACSHGMLTHSVRTPERPASPRLAVAPTHSLLFAPQARHGSRPDHRASLGAAAGRALGYRPRLNCEFRGQLRGPRSPRSWPGKLIETRSVCRPRLAPALPRTPGALSTDPLAPPHQVTLDAACIAHNPQRLLLGRRRVETVDAEVDDVGSTKPSMAPAVLRPRRFVSLTRAYKAVTCEPSCASACGPEAGCRGYSAPTSPVLH